MHKRVPGCDVGDVAVLMQLSYFGGSALFLRGEGCAATSVIGKLLTSVHIQVHGFHMAFSHVFVSQLLTAHFAGSLGQLPVEDLLRNAGIIHTGNVASLSQLSCSWDRFHVVHIGPPENFDVRYEI